MTTKQQVLRKLNDEKRGDIDSGDYKPFLLIHDFSSHGRASRTKYKEREVHTMSDLETAAFCELCWAPQVIDIYEQVPLDREKTRQLSEAIGVRHPRLSGDGEYYPFTTDLVARCVIDGEERIRAFSVKPTSQLTMSKGMRSGEIMRVANTIAKLEIERRYWKSQSNADWYLVTEHDVSSVRKYNIELLLNPPTTDVAEDVQIDRLFRAMMLLEEYPHLKLSAIARLFSAERLVSESVFADLVRTLCSYRELSFDLNKPFSLNLLGGDFVRGLDCENENAGLEQS